MSEEALPALPLVQQPGQHHPGWHAHYQRFIAAGVVAVGGWTGAIGGDLPAMAGSLVGSTTGQIGGSLPALAGTGLTDQAIIAGTIDNDDLPALTGSLATASPVVTTQSPGTSGEAPVMVSALSGGNKIAHGTRLLVVNDSGGSVTLTIATPYVAEGLGLTDGTVTIPAGSWPANARLADVPFGLYAQPGDGLCHLTWSSTAGVAFAVLGRHAV